MLPTNNDTQNNQDNQNTAQPMELNDEFVKLQSCLYSILKAKKKLKVFKQTFSCSAEVLEDVELKLRTSYTLLTNILDAHTACDCSDYSNDSSSDDDEIVMPQ